VEPCSSAPVRLGVVEAEEAASLFLASLAWDVEPDLLSLLSMDNAADEVEGAEGSAFNTVGELMLHLSGRLVYEMAWEGICALTVRRSEARAGLYLNGELSWRCEWC
jgi:hypothetical protein